MLPACLSSKLQQPVARLCHPVQPIMTCTAKLDSGMLSCKNSSRSDIKSHSMWCESLQAGRRVRMKSKRKEKRGYSGSRGKAYSTNISSDHLKCVLYTLNVTVDNWQLTSASIGPTRCPRSDLCDPNMAQWAQISIPSVWHIYSITLPCSLHTLLLINNTTADFIILIHFTHACIHKLQMSLKVITMS